jgi:hypothetical protein|tara:strand:+ start:171 stop:290 length:120 start_codon:yes stop_codon:yes gene_type:complete
VFGLIATDWNVGFDDEVIVPGAICCLIIFVGGFLIEFKS